ncbi:CBS domain protein [Barrientosiimonas humi]|uniref:CBS domain protein n=1 Tax=Barrientosiimonas humi TaxID=999931 RepID=A0A542XEZ5_9MICO|nr:CBS domain-containing protein [Barrientosiimonas humi]TQL34390.1 CBS domain protein [Barrientosiimonas humi]CAG7574380.1 Inosine-5'-monophosphate dehydrogenase [Barrientosiimonas humi]
MRINDVLRNKGNQVVTIRSDATVGDLVDLLGEHGIGAVVVVDDPEAPAPVGIVSERDVVRRLRDGGVDYLASPVARIMTTDVLTCQPDDEIEGVARQLTEHRIRHLPVLADGRLAGIVSIGDVVKQRMDELQAERDHLTTYIQG